ncbi:MAG: TlpA disulfide reductase family protein [Candidatus Neomarinimicrobiota bacterium]
MWRKCLAILVVFFTIGQAQDDTTLVRIGQTVPDFKVTTLDGKIFDIKDCRGKIILLNFFATWCGPCLQEMPHLETEIWQKYKNDGLVVLAIGREHTAVQLDTFRQENKFSFQIAPDPQRKIYSLFATVYIPRNILIDRDGRIIYLSIGYDKKEFALLADLIGQKLKAGK